MIRRIAVLVSFVMAGFVPALAQTPPPSHAPGHPQKTHPPSHPQGRPHHHTGPVDPAVHAAMHARLLGTWTGTLSAPEGVAGPFHLSVANDKTGKLTLTVSADRPGQAGAVSDLALDSHGLHWTQSLSGVPCKATAILQAGTEHASDTMKGTMACEHGDIAFALQKAKG